MARNMVRTNEAAFRVLSDRLVSLQAEDAKRWVKTNEVEKAWLKNVEWIDEFRFDPNNWIIQCRHEDLLYYVTVGFELDDLSDQSPLQEAELNAGLFTALLAEKEIVRQDVDEIEVLDRALIPAGDGYDGQHLEDLRDLCRPISLLSVAFDTPMSEAKSAESALHRTALYCMASAKKMRSLPYSSRAIDRCKVLAADIDARVPWGMLAYALVAVRWDHAYLDVYRCIERLFPLPKMLELKQALQVRSPGLGLSKDIEGALGWRQREEDGMTSLFEAVDALCFRFYSAYSAHWTDGPEKYTPKSMALHFYKLRNSIVHFRPITEQRPFTYERWGVVLENFIELTEELYREFANEL